MCGFTSTTSCSELARRRNAVQPGLLIGALALIGSCWLGGLAAKAQVEVETKTAAADGTAFDQFGSAVAISGHTAVVGSPRDDDGGSSSGSAYVFEYDGLRWIQVAKLRASDAAATDMFGTAVGIEGEVIVVGAPFSDHVSANAGAVFLFEKPGGGWLDMTETATLNASDPVSRDGFGSAVDIDSEVVVVGSPQKLSNGTGKVYLFEMPINGWMTMTETAILTGSRARAGDLGGAGVAIHGGVVAVGFPRSDLLKQDAGIVLVFERPDSGWVSAVETAGLWSDDSLAGDQLGFSVSTTGANIVAGAPFHDAAASDGGAAYIFRANANGWRDSAQEAKLLASVADPIDEFGSVVSMDGDLVLVGARKNDSAGTNAGAAFVFRRPQSGWTEMVENDYLVAADSANSDGFGTAVASDGFLALIGSPFDDDRGSDSGSLYTIDLTPQCLDLEVFNLVAGKEATFVVRNGRPGRRFVVVYGLGGPAKTYINIRGFCATFDFSFITLKNVFGSGVFTREGIGNLVVPIDPDLIGFTLKMQAAERGTCPDECVSNLVKREVQ